ncbi:hypothetical protein B0H10DRAFT_1021653 [Mycena sp. CBHHK59/15]|nr:hypothetical protein B0H10DRAFT_1021653 [Mycena sp. CBHHK59/15]
MGDDTLLSVSFDCSNYAASNPDISGIGVRVSFYLQTFLLVILVDRSWQDAPTALWTFIATSAGLVIATITQHQSNDLTFLEALQVSNLVWLANFGTFVALASYSRQKAASHKELNARVGPDYNVKFGAMVQTLFSMALTIYMWSTAESFGTMPQCSHLISYMVFAVKVPAIGAGKIVGLTASSFLTAAYILITLHELRSYHRSRKGSTLPVLTQSSTKTIFSSASIPTAGSDNYSLPGLIAPVPYHKPSQSHILPQYSKKSDTQVRHVAHKRRPRRRRWSYEVDPMLIGIMICQIMVFTYFIVSSELLLANNAGVGVSSDKQMGFGQILALIVVLPSALSVVGALKEHGLKRLSKRKKVSIRRNQSMGYVTDNT